MFSTSYFVFSYHPVSPPIFSHLWIRAAPPFGIPRTAGRGTSEESSSAGGQLLQRLRNHLRNLDRDTQLRPQWGLKVKCKRRMNEERGKMKSLLHHGTSQVRQNWLRWESSCQMLFFLFSYLITPKYHCMSAVVACLLETGEQNSTTHHFLQYMAHQMVF